MFRYCFTAIIKCSVLAIYKKLIETHFDMLLFVAQGDS